MKKRETRSPIKSLLRLPGQWTREEADRILDEDVMSRLISAIFTSGALIMVWYAVIFDLNVRVATGLTIIGCLYIAYEIRQALVSRSTYKKYKLGAEGEIAVGQQLDELREVGYKIFHDVQTGHGNIDHIIVGPAGVFAIETKTMSKPIGRSYDADYYDTYLDQHKIQAKDGANWLEQFIADKTERRIDVQPVLMYPGWFTAINSNSNVWVFNPIRFIKHIGNLTPVITPAEINRISGYIEHHVKIL